MTGTDSSGILEEIQVWARRLEDARRVIVCRPELAEQIRDLLADLGPAAALLEVRPSDACPEGKVIVMPTTSALLKGLDR